MGRSQTRATVPNPDGLVDEISVESDTSNLEKPSASGSPHVSNSNKTSSSNAEENALENVPALPRCSARSARNIPPTRYGNVISFKGVECRVIWFNAGGCLRCTCS